MQRGQCRDGAALNRGLAGCKDLENGQSHGWGEVVIEIIQ